MLTKQRPDHNEAEITLLIGDVEGRAAILIDDMIDTAGTLCAGAKVVKDAGATRIFAAATHGLLSGQRGAAARDSVIEEVVLSDTVPLPPEAADLSSSGSSPSTGSSPTPSTTSSATSRSARSSPGRTSSSRRFGGDVRARPRRRARREMPGVRLSADRADRHRQVAGLHVGSILAGALRLYRQEPARVAGASLVILLPLVLVGSGIHALEEALGDRVDNEAVVLLSVLPAASGLLTSWDWWF